MSQLHSKVCAVLPRACLFEILNRTHIWVYTFAKYHQICHSWCIFRCLFGAGNRLRPIPRDALYCFVLVSQMVWSSLALAQTYTSGFSFGKHTNRTFTQRSYLSEMQCSRSQPRPETDVPSAQRPPRRRQPDQRRSFMCSWCTPCNTGWCFIRTHKV